MLSSCGFGPNCKTLIQHPAGASFYAQPVDPFAFLTFQNSDVPLRKHTYRLNIIHRSHLPSTHEAFLSGTHLLRGYHLPFYRSVSVHLTRLVGSRAMNPFMQPNLQP